MVKRLVQDPMAGPIHVPPGLGTAPVLDLMCSHFVLTLAAKQGGLPPAQPKVVQLAV